MMDMTGFSHGVDVGSWGWWVAVVFGLAVVVMVVLLVALIVANIKRG